MAELRKTLVKYVDLCNKDACDFLFNADGNEKISRRNELTTIEYKLLWSKFKKTRSIEEWCSQLNITPSMHCNFLSRQLLVKTHGYYLYRMLADISEIYRKSWLILSEYTFFGTQLKELTTTELTDISSELRRLLLASTDISLSFYWGLSGDNEILCLPIYSQLINDYSGDRSAHFRAQINDKFTFKRDGFRRQK